jgi:hypothetical protein
MQAFSTTEAREEGTPAAASGLSPAAYGAAGGDPQGNELSPDGRPSVKRPQVRPKLRLLEILGLGGTSAGPNRANRLRRSWGGEG